MTVTVSAFYKFIAIDDCATLAAELRGTLAPLGIKGTVLLAREGINATVSGSAEAISSLHLALRRDARFADLTDKRSQAAAHPFSRLKIKIKPEIVTFGLPEADPSRLVGTYVDPRDWNELVCDPDVIVVDTRNTYEVSIGSFPGALDPLTEKFSDFPSFVQARLLDAKSKRVAMFCTGGIRCEKASAYLLSQGFSDVYHLEGGILKYLEVVPKSESLWQGECFIFDDRVSLEHGVVTGQHVRCTTCGAPVARTRATDHHNDDDDAALAICCAKCAKISG